MVPVRGFEKPWVQWLMAAGCVVLAGLLVATTLRVRRSARELAHAAGALRTEARARESLESQLTRERATREAFGLELSRLRSSMPDEPASAAAGRPTLTLTVSGKRTGSPPAATVVSPRPDQVVELRLPVQEMPPDADRLRIVARDWSTGRARWSIGRCRATSVEGRPMLAAFVTGEMLAPGVYEIALVRPAESSEGSDAIVTYELAISAGS